MNRCGAAPWVTTSLLLLVGTAGCGTGDAGDGSRTLTVYAAASLAAPFEVLAADLEARHADVEVRLTTGGSADLATQIDQGAPADVYASADTRTMQRLVEADLVEDPELVASNRLRLVVPPGNPAAVEELGDVTGPDVDLVVCAPVVPCGDAALRLAERAGVVLRPVSEEQSVTDVLAKVVAGEADAGLVYATDALAAGDAVTSVPVPEAGDVVNVYPVAVVEGSDEAALAREFRDLVLGPRGRSVLVDHGFGRP